MPFVTNINPYDPLSTEELKITALIEKGILSKDANRIASVQQFFKKHHLHTLAKFQHHNATIREFFESNSEAKKTLAEKLKDLGCANIDVISKDQQKQESHSLLDHAWSNYLLYAFTSTKREDTSGSQRIKILTDACSLGSYQGLVMRCVFNRSILASPTVISDPEKQKKYIQKILLDSDRLANLYGALGYVRKGLNLLFLSEFFNKEDKNHDKVLSQTYENQAIKSFICGHLLEDDVYSATLMAAITQNKGISALFKNDDSENFAVLEKILSNWDRLQEVFINASGTEDKDNYEMLYKQASLEIKADLQRKTLINDAASSPSPQ